MYLKLGLIIMMACMSTIVTAKAQHRLPNQGFEILHPKAPQVKVLIAKDLFETVVEVKGPYKIYDPNEYTLFSTGTFGKCYPVSVNSDGLKWGEEFPGTFQIAIVPTNGATTTLVDGVCYKGIVYIYGVGNKINIVNQVNVEDFLKETLAAQYKDNLSDEALAALAIAARTTAYYQTERYNDAFYQYDAEAVSYSGLSGLKKKGVDRAVNATRYLVMRQPEKSSYKGLFVATWTAHCAGRSASAKSIFRKETSGPSGAVESALAASDRDNVSWTYMVRKADLAKMVGATQISGLTAYTDNSSGKVYAVRLQSSSGNREMDFTSLQTLLGAEKLQSSDFAISNDQDIITFTGYGKGPGTGLCLYTACKMAEHGLDAVKVLRKFFPGTEVVMMPLLTK
ncbi:MAG: hypothetical protein NTY13_01290 [Chlamydiae bacterium]|nr:hypothetical protein [Chlamydiota bacterium]